MMKTDRRKLKNDMIFVFVLLFSFLLIAAYTFFRGEGDRVIVTVDRKIYGEYALSEDTVVEIRGGDFLNVLVIRDGKAYMEAASCPDGICTDHKPIYRNGESLVCLPNKVVVAVSAKKGSRSDIVV